MKSFSLAVAITSLSLASAALPCGGQSAFMTIHGKRVKELKSIAAR